MKEQSLNYHLMIDEKFIDDFAKDALSITDNNRFIFTFDPPSKFVKNTEGIHAPYGSKKLEKTLKSISEHDRIFVHWHSPKVNTILDKIPKKTKVYLCFWGGDFLESPFFSHPINRLNEFLFDPLTLQYVKQRIQKEHKKIRESKNKSAKDSGNVKNMVATRLQNMKQSAKSLTNKAYSEGMKERAVFLNRLEAICHWNTYDVEILNELYDVKLKHHYFVYGVGTDELPAKTDVKGNSDTPLTIWLGNSDTETNNHLDALNILKAFKNDDIKIICPLNYGNKKYAQLIADKGTGIFGKKFVPLLDFIPRDEYYSLMDEVDIAFMPHNRGQAGGNLFAFIKKGKKVYMKEQSSIYQLFKSLGMHIYDSEGLKNTKVEDLKKPLIQELIDQNIEILGASISNEEKRMKALKELLLNE